MPDQTSLVLAGCQQLVLVDGELLGDPMERAALQAAGWLFASEGVCVNRDPSRRASLRIVQRYPFSSDLRRSATIAALEHRGPRLGAAPRTEGEIASPPRLAVLAKGAPEAMRALLATVPEGYDEAYMHHVRLGRRVPALTRGLRELPCLLCFYANYDGLTMLTMLTMLTILTILTMPY